MVYPQTKLTKTVRRGIMFFLIACFFIISPIIILYTTGYRYDFSTQQIRQTGVISIDVEPSKTQVFLNNVKIKKNLPLRLTNRAPGTYTVKLTLSGYQDWQKDITVESKKTTYIKNITLFKQALPILVTTNLKTAIVDMQTSYNGAYILITTKADNIYEIHLLNTSNNELFSIIRSKIDKIPEISWSPYANFALIKTQNNNKQQTLELFNPLTPENSKTYTFFTPIEDYQWSKNTFNSTVYIKQNNQFKSLSNNEQRSLNIVPSDIWFIDNNNIWSYSNKNLVKNNETKFALGDKDEIRKIIDVNNNRIIAQSDWHTYVFKLKDGEITNSQILPTQHVFYNQNTAEWQTWSWWELWTIYEDGSTSLLTRTSDKIIQLWPLDKYGVLALTSENKITGFNPGYYVSHELLHDTEIKQIGVNPHERKIFFLGRVGQTTGLFELEY